MSDMLSTGAAWLAGQLKEHAAQDVTYVRGAQRCNLSATIGATEFQIDELGGVRLESSDRDFIITVSDLILDGEITLPERGDMIKDSSGPNGETETFEVMAPGNIQPYRLDSTGKLLRIHAKKVNVT